MKIKTFFKQFSRSLFPIILALIIGYFIILFSGFNPNEAYLQLIRGSLSSSSQILNTLFAATPILLTGLATTISFKAGLYNMGAEGQLYLGGFAAAYVGFTLQGLSPLIHIILALLAGIVVGALFAFIPAILRAYLKVDEMVSTLMLNYVAILFTTWLASYPFRAPGASNPETVSVANSAVIPRIFSGAQLHYGFCIALLVFVIVYIMLKKTTLGYEIESIGKNPDFSGFVGINVSKKIVIIMVISGIISGLAGSIEILGTHGKFASGFSPDYGWTGLTIALIGNLHPVGVLLGSILFGILKTGGSTMEIMTGVPRSIILVLEGLIVIFLTVNLFNNRSPIFNKFRKKFQTKEKIMTAGEER
ncbi:ABC transporter permease [Amphibacillus sp. Q70]|uniref:ABC transporter permease n=1 Tax=Amphibacillus sp. Q70 TaxID=3453416 RepID=UPI003F87E34D